MDIFVITLYLTCTVVKFLRSSSQKVNNHINRYCLSPFQAIVRFKLYSEMINVLFPIMAETPEDEDDEDEDDDDAMSNLPSVAACQGRIV